MKKKMPLLYMLLLFMPLLTNCYSEQKKENNTVSEKALTAIDSFFLDKVEKKELAGAITLIVKNNEIEHLKAYGFIDIEQAIPMNTNVIIPIASMTKVITSVAIMQLVERGKLELDDPVEKYIPEFKDMKVFVDPDSTETENLKTKPTIRDLMRHTSGMVYSGGNSITDKLYQEAGFRNWNQPLQLFIEKVTKIPLAFQPNTEWQYSYSHDILGYLIEVVSGMTLDRFFEENIFRPLNLSDTGFSVPREKLFRLSNLYIYQNNRLDTDDNRNHSIYNDQPVALSGGGGWWNSYGGILTTVSDFQVIADMLLHYGAYNGKQIVSEESVDMIIKNQIGHISDGDFKFGFGVGVNSLDDDPDKTKSIYWAGSPYNTYFLIDYTENMICILFTNTAPFGHLNMMDTFKEIVYQ